jgi:hypothetical protein
MGFIVTEKAQRPANMNGCCFYCGQPIGTEHKGDCVLINKKVNVRLTVEYEIEVPAHWGQDQIEFHRNEGSWCSSNAISELESAFGDESEHCMCNAAEFEYLGSDTEPFLDEG